MFNLPDADRAPMGPVGPAFGPPRPPGVPFTYSQSPVGQTGGGFSLGGGGGRGNFSMAGLLPGSQGISSSRFGGGHGMPGGHNPYTWGMELGRMFARKRLNDFLSAGGGHQTPGKFPPPPQF